MATRVALFLSLLTAIYARPAPGDVIDGPVVELLPGVFRATYYLHLPPLTPGEVLVTDPKETLLKAPQGKNAILSVEIELRTESGAALPLSRLYNHHFVIHSLPLKDESASTFGDGGGAEWRGVQAQRAWKPDSPGAGDVPSAAALHDSSDAQLGLNLHIIDLRGVDKCGAWEGNVFDNRWPSSPAGSPLPCKAPTDPSAMRGVSQCIQCNCMYYQLNNNNVSIRPSAPLSGGLSCCSSGSFCDLGGRYSTPDGGALWPEDVRRKYSTGIVPDDEPWAASYIFEYNMTYRAWDESTMRMVRHSFQVESSARARFNGLLSAFEYQVSTCGLCRTKSCGQYDDFYSAAISATYPGKEGYDEGTAPPQTYPFTRAEFIEAASEAGMLPREAGGLSRCNLGNGGKVMSVLAFSWVAPYDLDVLTANAHQHVGGLGVKLYVQGAEFGAVRRLLCHSKPTYGSMGTAEAGFLISLSVCNFKQPVRISKGTILSVESAYYADREPFPIFSADGSMSEPSQFQLPWTGAMGYLGVGYTIASPPPHGYWTANGMQPSLSERQLMANLSSSVPMYM